MLKMHFRFELVQLFVLIFMFKSTFSSRILAVVPTPSYSHQAAFYSLWEELSLRGHHVTLITTNPMNDSSLTNLTEIDLSFMYKEDRYTDANKIAELGILGLLDVVVELGSYVIDKELRHANVQKIINNEKEYFDIALIEVFFPGMLAFGKRFNCPVIQLHSLDAMSTNYYVIGNPIHPVLNPDYLLPFSGKLTFVERLISTLFSGHLLLFSKYRLFPSQQEVVKKYFGSDYPDIESMLSDVSLMFVNTDFIFHPIRPLLPNVIQIGGGTHLRKPKPLSKNLQGILDDANGGFIYFSLGSSVKSNLLPIDIRNIFMESFSELPYTVLWKFEEENLPGKPDNVIISKWFPQQDIFRHLNIKAFISQGGLQSMEEAIYNHIPIIGIPFLADQKSNIKRMVTKGLGLQLNKNTLAKTTLKEAILEVIGNPKYRNRVKELAELARDQPMTGLERAVWWTEYVIRHKGAKHLRSSNLNLPAYQYYLLDVIGFVLALSLFIVFILIKVVKVNVMIVRNFLLKSKQKIDSLK